MAPSYPVSARRGTGSSAGWLPMPPLPLDWKMPAELSKILSSALGQSWKLTNKINNNNHDDSHEKKHDIKIH